MKIIRTRLTVAKASGQRKSWFRIVTGVDKKRKDGYAFEGHFLQTGCDIDIEVGSIVIEKEPCGSANSGQHTANLYVVVEDEIEGVRNGHLCFIEEWDWRKQFLSFRDAVAQLLIEKEDERAAATAAGVDSRAGYTTVGDLVARLLTLPQDAIVVNSADHINGAWSRFKLQPVKIALNSAYYDGYHRVLEDFLMEDHREDYPNEKIVNGYHI
jgi:hypothetical protein